MKTITKKPIFSSIVALIALCFVFNGSLIHAITSTSVLHEELNIVRGDIEAIKVFDLTRVSITDPDVADIVDADGEEVVVMAKSIGRTVLFLWDSYGKRSVVINVLDEDLDLVQMRIEDLLVKSEVEGVITEVSPMEAKVILTGTLPEYDIERLDTILEPVSSSVLNLVKLLDIEDLIQIDMEIVEVSTSVTKQLGFDWTSQIQYKETFPSDIDGSADWLKIGSFNRVASDSTLSTFFTALETEGKGRILSRPKLVVANGKEASFLAGGEIPLVKVASTEGSIFKEEVEYKEYGVGLTVTPIIRGEKVDILLNVEVSDVDPATAIGSGTDIAFTTRNAQTQLFLDNGQTIILAGLIKKTRNDNVSKVPFLGDVPIIGAMFRKKGSSSPDLQEVELVISLTPTIMPGGPREEKLLTSKEKKIDLSSRVVESRNSGTALVAQNEAPYIQTVQRRISEAITYPYSAQQQGLEGTVKLNLRIAKDGSLEDITVGQSSGSSIFDEDAINTAQILSPYPAFPAELNSEIINVTIPIVYSQNSYLTAAPAQRQVVVSRPYAELVQQKIAEAVVYPEEAREYGWEGTVKIALHILNDGTLAYTAVKESSGNEMFDEDAIQTVKRIAPFFPFPPESDLQEMRVTVPIVYSLVK
ncbi:MAG: TonB family protein [bacterium]|nr:TonB family protein [bacterium]